jgi:hypothetical protein
MYVNFYAIGRIRMDIDSRGYLGPGLACKASNVEYVVTGILMIDLSDSDLL